jgi:hypothetical protein
MKLKLFLREKFQRSFLIRIQSVIKAAYVIKAKQIIKSRLYQAIQ